MNLRICIFCFLTTLAAFSQNTARELQRVIEIFHGENPMAPGVSSFVKSTPLDLEWSGVSGRVRKAGDAPLRPEHVVRMASNTKTYVASAILRLVEEGQLRLQMTLADLLSEPILELLKRDGYPVERMTLAQVLSHTSGLNEHPADPRYEQALIADPQHRWTPEEQIEKCVEWMEPLGAPGEKYAYSDTGYILLGLIIERTTGNKLGPAVRELLDYKKLGLRVTFWEYMETPLQAPPRAHQYYGDLDVTDWHASFDLYGGGGLISNPREMGLFMEALLLGNVFNDPETLETMKTTGSERYKLGLMHVQLDGREAFGHQGFWNTFAYYIPSLNATVAGSISNHHAKNGRVLAEKLVTVLADTR